MIFKQNLDTTYLSAANVRNLASSDAPLPQPHWRFFREPLWKFSGQKYFTTLSQSHNIQFCIVPFSPVFFQANWILTWAVHKCHCHLQIIRWYHGNSNLPQSLTQEAKGEQQIFLSQLYKTFNIISHNPLIAYLMSYRQGRWTEYWLNFCTARAVSPEERKPQRADGGLNTFISVGRWERAHPQKICSRDRMGNSSVLKLWWTSIGQTNGQRAEKSGLREILFMSVNILSMYINIWWGVEKGKHVHSGIQWIEKLENLLTHKRKGKNQTNSKSQIFHCHCTPAANRLPTGFLISILQHIQT